VGGPRPVISEAEIEARVGQIKAVMWACGHDVTEVGLRTVRRILQREITGEEARAETIARYREPD
jgi:hypothetical protein